MSGPNLPPAMRGGSGRGSWQLAELQDRVAALEEWAEQVSWEMATGILVRDEKREAEVKKAQKEKKDAGTKTEKSE